MISFVAKRGEIVLSKKTKMRILLAVKLKDEEELNFLSNNIIYRPDLVEKSEKHLISTIIDTASEIVVTTNICNEKTFKDKYNDFSKLRKVIVISKSFTGFRVKEIEVIKFSGKDNDLLSELFGFIESIFLDNERVNFNMPRLRDKYDKKISLIGSGIVNLFIGFELAKEGFEVTFFDSRQDPRQISSDRHNQLGSTFGGEDARVFSFTECRHHFTSKKNVDLDYFRKSILEEGRICADANSFNKTDEEWIENFEKIPLWISSLYHEDMVNYNKLSYELWLKFFEERRDVAKDVGFADKLFRVYSSKEKYNAAFNKLNANKSFLNECSRHKFLEINPCFQDAWDNGHIYKALAVKGFSVNVHRLGKFFISQIEKLGGKFNWNSEVFRLNRNSKGKIINLELKNGKVIDSEIVIFCPGAYGENILQETKAKGVVSSMIGMWLKIPNASPSMNYPIKISRSGVGVPGPCESANIITGKDNNGENCIFISSGHGYVGFNQKIDKSYINQLGKGVIDVALKYFPNKIKESQSQLEERLTYCIRGWTPSCLGVFDIEEKEKGFMLLIAGHNTGGFAQAPIISENVKKVIMNENSDMVFKYNSQRAKRFLKF